MGTYFWSLQYRECPGTERSVVGGSWTPACAAHLQWHGRPSLAHIWLVRPILNAHSQRWWWHDADIVCGCLGDMQSCMHPQLFFRDRAALSPALPFAVEVSSFRRACIFYCPPNSFQGTDIWANALDSGPLLPSHPESGTVVAEEGNGGLPLP